VRTTPKHLEMMHGTYVQGVIEKSGNFGSDSGPKHTEMSLEGQQCSSSIHMGGLQPADRR